MNYNKLIELLEIPNILLSKGKEELRVLLGQDFAITKDYPQNNPHHRYNLLEHTVKTVEAVDCGGLTKDEAVELKTAALFHDVGKPVVAFIKNGRTVFYNHAKESRIIAEKNLKQIGFKGEVLGRILFYIEYHDAFISFKCPNEIKDKSNQFLTPIQKDTVNSKIISIQNECKNQGAYIPTYKDFLLLLRLCLADAEAQSNEVIQHGILVDSKSRKKGRLNKIIKFVTENFVNNPN